MTLTADSVITVNYAHNSFGHVLPGPDGKSIFTGLGKYKPQVTMMETAVQGAKPLIPACHGETYLTLPSVGRFPGGRPDQRPGKTEVTINAPGKAEPLATVTDLEVTFAQEDFIKDDFTNDKRVHFIPDARLIITIPATNDRVVLRRLDITASPTP